MHQRSACPIPIENRLSSGFLSVACYLVAALSGVCAADGSALKFNGTSNRVDIGTALISNDITMSAWVKADTPWVNDTRVVLSNSHWGAAANRVGFHLMLQANGTPASRFQTQADGVGVWSVTGTTNVVGAWHHLAYVKQGTKISIVVDGKEEASRNDMPASVTGLAVLNQIRIGCHSGNARFFAGIVDEVRIWNYARTVAEIQESMTHELRGTEAGLVGYWKLNEGQGTTTADGAPVPHNGTIVGATWTTDAAPITPGPAPASAQGPSPVRGAVDVPRDVVLIWRSGGYVDTHDVYLGTVSADVDSASRIDPKGVLVSQAQDANTYEPAAVLEFGKTYYWRVDEVNAPAKPATFKGEVWSFTVEPYSYPISNVVATASSTDKTTAPAQNVVNGSGLTGDLHSVVSDAMWLSSATGEQPTWIQFQFPQACMLDEMWVWNHNLEFEPVLGYGFKDTLIEHSVDGTTWTVLGDVQFAQSSARTGYAHNTTVDFGGVMARYVRLTAKSNWSAVGLKQYGLSEVRFFQVPVVAREPYPADRATGMPLDTTLTWRPGREAASHGVYFGVDANAVADGAVPDQILDGHGYDPGPLDFGTTYYWKVDEVNEAMDLSLHEGSVWSFTTLEYAILDDMESYDDDNNRIYDSWVDGVTTQASGSQVGYDAAPFAEKMIVHGGKQSMPFKYDNADAPFFSEAEREFSPAQDLTLHGADTLSLWVRGNPPAYRDEGGTITMSAAGHDIWDNADDFRFAHKTLNGNGSILVRVESLVNTNNWAKAGVMIRQSLDADSKFVYFIVSYAQGVSMGSRALLGGTCTSVTQAGIAAPQWVKLTRTGDAFTAQYCADGKTWIDLKAADGTVASTSLVMTNPVYIGLCVTSHNAAATTTAQMSNLAITGTVSGELQVATIGDDPQPANDPMELYVTIQDSSGKTATVKNPSLATQAAWTQWEIPLSDLTGVNLRTVKKMFLGAGSRTSPVKGGSGLLYIDDVSFGHPAQ